MTNSVKVNTEIAQEHFLLNGNIVSTNDFKQEETTVFPSVYEVIRVIDGVPLFFEEHLERLSKSLEILNYTLPWDESFIKEQLYQLINLNQCYNYNIKIVINGLDTENENLFVYFITSKYPLQEQYESGVHTILYEAERENPNAKIIAKSFRDAVTKRMVEANAYEAILVNQKGEITEGSKSNIFLVKDNVFYTSPAKDVLLGITRHRVIQLCLQLGYAVKEEAVPVSFIEEADGLFITGTSPKVLPIASVDDRVYHSSSNSAIVDLQRAYDNLIREYIKKSSVD